MANDEKTILVFGATGAMGGAVVEGAVDYRRHFQHHSRGHRGENKND